MTNNEITTKLEKYLISFINSEEYHTIKKEIWTEEIYKTRLLSQNPIIVDIGAHIGIATLYFKNEYPNGRIFSFEPIPLTYNLLVRNIGQNSLKDIWTYNYAVANKNGSEEYYADSSEDAWFSTASYLPKAWNNRQNTKKLSVNTCDFSLIFHEILEKTKADSIDLLKIDVEGGEIKILKSILEKHKDKIIRNIVIELHPIENTQQKAVRILRKLGYEVKLEEHIDGLKIAYAHK